ncbi:multicopper oxidase domain-containing protein [Candidatus Obscuribacterales bacterium]|nr:multicopper oxidase domain-containing protein [Candidatus Obscuribacterales bacterium]
MKTRKFKHHPTAAIGLLISNSLFLAQAFLIAETFITADAVFFAKAAQADLMDGDLAEEQAKEKEELRDMKREMDDINSTVDSAMGQLNDLGQKFNNQQNAKEFHLFARESDWETASGSTVRCLTYNGKIPGPAINVVEGDFVRVVLHNQMKTPTSLQFHGIIVPHSVGGLPRTGAGLVPPGQSFVFQFIAKQPGTFWYHPQVVHPTQKQMGMFGAIVVAPKLRSRPIDKDVTLFISEIRKAPRAVSENAAPVATRKVTGQKVSKGAEVSSTPAPATVDAEPSKSNFSATAWTDGAAPPDLETDYLINGKSAPNIPPIELRKGQRVRLRLINAGQEAVPLQLGGHRLEIVSLNGGDRLEPHVLRDTICLNPSDRVDVEFSADNPGVWSLASEVAHQSTHKGKFPGGIACVVRYSELKTNAKKQPGDE